ncbi:MAG: hypothetical protein KatS3mg110_1617 [Pirellulaceae bacterium]|nr:MAG: hypothetical protein KatS3mg110_1617 [Pirellulaceae bacterium]
MWDELRPDIDRLAPRCRPSRRQAGWQSWRDLVFLHWEVPADLLRPLVPEELALDTWQGRAFAGIVAFAMQGVRPWWWPPWMALRLLETNVRTYVVYDGKPGVYFFSLDANHLPAVLGARLGWSLPYYPARIERKKGNDGEYYSVRRWSSSGVLELRYQPGSSLPASDPDSLEFFLLERYLLFVKRGGRIRTGQVYHTPYPVQQVAVTIQQQTLLQTAGINVPTPTAAQYAHFSAGVDVEVFSLV